MYEGRCQFLQNANISSKGSTDFWSAHEFLSSHIFFLAQPENILRLLIIVQHATFSEHKFLDTYVCVLRISIYIFKHLSICAPIKIFFMNIENHFVAAGKTFGGNKLIGFFKFLDTGCAIFVILGATKIFGILNPDKKICA